MLHRFYMYTSIFFTIPLTPLRPKMCYVHCLRSYGIVCMTYIKFIQLMAWLAVYRLENVPFCVKSPRRCEFLHWRWPSQPNFCPKHSKVMNKSTKNRTKKIIFRFQFSILSWCHSKYERNCPNSSSHCTVFFSSSPICAKMSGAYTLKHKCVALVAVNTQFTQRHCCRAHSLTHTDALLHTQGENYPSTERRTKQWKASDFHIRIVEPWFVLNGEKRTNGERHNVTKWINECVVCANLIWPHSRVHPESSRTRWNRHTQKQQREK